MNINTTKQREENWMKNVAVLINCFGFRGSVLLFCMTIFTFSYVNMDLPLNNMCCSCSSELARQWEHEL